MSLLYKRQTWSGALMERPIYIAIIDGTGGLDNKYPILGAGYVESMKNSFCVQLSTQLGCPVSGPRMDTTFVQYQRGPTIDGITTLTKGEVARDFLVKAKERDPSARLMLAGYSRGGSAAILAAELMAKQALVIDSMFLFDPVAIHNHDGGEIIPANVGQVFVASRDYDDDLIREYDGRFTKLGKAAGRSLAMAVLSPFTQAVLSTAAQLTSNWSHPMRPGFGKTAVFYAGTGIHVPKAFRGSHGALGGVGWENVTEDKSCQIEVANWMSGWMRYANLPVSLKSVPPTQVWT